MEALFKVESSVYGELSSIFVEKLFRNKKRQNRAQSGPHMLDLLRIMVP